MWPRLSLANRNCDFVKKIVGDRNCDILSVWTIFNAFYEQHLHCAFGVHAVCTVHDYFIILTRTLPLNAKKHYRML